TGYFHETQTVDTSAERHFQAFQTVSGSLSGLASGKLVLRGSGRFDNDLAISPHEFQTGRWYSGYAEARLNPRFKARLGRQFLQSGVSGLTLDGAWLSYRHDHRLSAALWGGARAPVVGDFALGDLSEEKTTGAKVTLRPNPRWRLALSGAYREREGRVAERPVGLEVGTSALPSTRLLARAAYDLEADRWSRVQLQARWQKKPTAPVVNLQWLDRHPSIDAASWFSRFTRMERIKVARLSVAHTLASRFGGEVEFLGTYVGARTSTRLGLAVLYPLGRVGYSVRLGDAGEESRFYGEMRVQALRWLQLDAQASVLTYALLEDAPADDERELIAMVAGFRADLRPGMRLVGQVQSLDNPYYSQDIRVVLGLDLSMARGPSNLGLGRGGWLQ
nr:hypothetical protein [Candidatus Krumholzibacteria bacterium]